VRGKLLEKHQLYGKSGEAQEKLRVCSHRKILCNLNTSYISLHFLIIFRGEEEQRERERERETFKQA